MCQLKITLRDIEPPVWRRVLVPADLPLGNLHDVIQLAMGWEDCHLHQFELGKRQFADPHPENSSEQEDEWSMTVGELLPVGGALSYWYDFGDDWWHDIVLEECGPREPDAPLFRLLAGERACPPEDSGGPHGYAYKLDVVQNPSKHDQDEVAETIEWLGDDFDPDLFDVAKADEILQSSFE